MPCPTPFAHSLLLLGRNDRGAEVLVPTFKHKHQWDICIPLALHNVYATTVTGLSSYLPDLVVVYIQDAANFGKNSPFH